MAAILNQSSSVHFYLDQEEYNRIIPSATDKNLENLIKDILEIISKDYERVDFISLVFYDDLRAHKYVEIVPACRKPSLECFVKASSISEIRKVRFSNIARQNAPICVRANLIPFHFEEEKEDIDVNPLFSEYIYEVDESGLEKVD